MEKLIENGIDPYKMLKISRNYTLEELRAAYKKIALSVHPDKGGSDYLFQLVTLCYKALAKEYHKRAGDRQYHELKSQFKQYQVSPNPVPTNPMDNQRFDLEKFNQVFSTHKIQQPTDIGYDDFLKKGPTTEVEPKNIFQNTKFSNDRFNKVFEKVTTQTQEKNKYIVKYKEPEALPASKKIAFTEIGTENVDDWSGDNTTRKSLNFMDLKIAHTTQRIVDPKTVGTRKEFKTIDEYEADRGNISYSMDEEERIYQAKKKKLEELKEQARLQRAMKQDQMAFDQYKRVHQLLLGGTR